MKSAPLTSCQQAAEAFRVAMHNIGALEDVAFSLPTDDSEEEEEIQEGLAQWLDRASEEDYSRDLGMREWREGGDWRLVDGADGNYNSGLEQPESEPEQNAVEAFDSRKQTGGHCLASLPASNQIRQPEY